MKWSSAVSEGTTLAAAFDECALRLEDELGGLKPHMVAAFVSPHYAPQYETLTALAGERFDGALLVGCSGGGVIGAATEVENRPGLALTAAHLPDVRMTPFHIQYGALPDGTPRPTNGEHWLTHPSARKWTFSFLPTRSACRASNC